MKRPVLAALLVLLAVVPAPLAFAHEGHAHKIMGTVSVIHENHLEVTAVKDSKVSTVVLNEKTKILRGKTVLQPEDIKIGDRVVVTAVQEKDDKGKEMLIATEVRVGAPAAAKTQ